MAHSLGALILLRSALETLATLIYLNQLTASVLEGSLNFHAFSDKTTVLLLGSRNKTTDYSSINIQTVLQKCARRYDFIEQFYADLSESAHPNHEGLILGYSKPDQDNFIENFANHWSDMYSKTHEQKMSIVIMMFEHEYNDIWTEQFSALEEWLVTNDETLEATKNNPRA
jgi:lipopolysaccharide assembly outer membrane protein LptD (OstA)